MELFSVLIAVVTVITIYLILCVFVHLSLILGTKNVRILSTVVRICYLTSGIFQRNPDKVVPYLVMTVIGIFLTFLELTASDLPTIVGVIVNIVINVYLYICIYSLYVKFKNEKKYKFPEEA